MASAPSKMMKRVFKAANGLHVALYRMSGGKFANKIANLPILLITTFGRKSGKPYTNAVVYIKDGQDYLVSATNGGNDTDPGWYLNLKTRPEAKMVDIIGCRECHGDQLQGKMDNGQPGPPPAQTSPGLCRSGRKSNS